MVAKLFACIHEGKLDTQNQLLHVLHSIITVSSAASAANRRKVSAARTSRGIGHVSRFSTSSTDTQGDEDPQASEPTSDNVSPLLMQTLMDGISSTTNRPVLQHWIDFILMTIPQFQGHLRPLLLPLCDCVIQQLQNLTYALHIVLKQPSSDQDLSLASSESVAIMFLSALERIVILALGHFPARPQESERSGSVDQSGGLLGYVSNVFSMEEAPVSKPSDGLMVGFPFPFFLRVERTRNLTFPSFLKLSLAQLDSSASPTPFESFNPSGRSRTASPRHRLPRPRKDSSSSAHGRAIELNRFWSISIVCSLSTSCKLWLSAGRQETFRSRFASFPSLLSLTSCSHTDSSFVSSPRLLLRAVPAPSRSSTFSLPTLRVSSQ